MTKLGCYISKLMGFYQHKYNKEWDILLNNLIDHGALIDIDNYTISVKLDDDIFEVWIENKPYASHTLRRKNGKQVPEKSIFSPSIKTQLKFEKWVSLYQQQVEEKELKENLLKFYGDKKND